MEQTDVKQRRLSPWKVGVAFAYRAVIICLGFFFWPDSVPIRQVYFIVENDEPHFYWDSRMEGLQTVKYQYDGQIHFPDVTAYFENGYGQRELPDGDRTIEISRVGEYVNGEPAYEDILILSAERGKYLVKITYSYYEYKDYYYNELEAIYIGETEFMIAII